MCDVFKVNQCRLCQTRRTDPQKKIHTLFKQPKTADTMSHNAPLYLAHGLYVVKD